MTFRGILSIVLGVVLFVAPAAWANEGVYAQLERDIARNSLMVLKDADPERLIGPDSRARFADSLAALDGTVARLFATMPPESEMARHLRLMPLYAQLLTAARSLNEALRDSDSAGMSAAREWLERAAVDLLVGMTASSP